MAASGQGGVLVRSDPDETARLIASGTARPMEMRRRPVKGWLQVDTDGVRTKR